MLKIHQIKFNKGFTLIELLVVISIISLLSSIMFASFNSARLKTRDAVRKSDFKQIQNALEIYYSYNNFYPVVARWACSPGISGQFSAAESQRLWDGPQADTLATKLNLYIKKLPKDPLNTTIIYPGPWADGYYSYCYSSNGTTYDLYTQLENRNDKSTCQYTCGKYHQGEGVILPEKSFCISGIPSIDCGAGANDYSDYIYVDH